MDDTVGVSVFTPEIAAEICRRLAEGESLRAVCRTEGMPGIATVLRWAVGEGCPADFPEQYARARQSGYAVMAEDLVDIADDGSNDWMTRAKANGEIEIVLDREHVARSKLRADTRQWMLSKMLPKVYGQRTTIAGDPDAPLTTTLDLSKVSRDALKILRAALPEDAAE